ncbi:MAG: hypothetical protein U5P41_05465 [Gammaproteobacteria bacterium]|nr:hypothetical protein [Gammaproteobacteria bacterium]
MQKSLYFLNKKLMQVLSELDRLNKKNQENYEARREDEPELEPPEFFELPRFWFRIVGYDAVEEEPETFDISFTGYLKYKALMP